MKKHLLVAALLGFGLAALTAIPNLATPASANSTTIGAPGNSGRPSQDNVTQARVDYVGLRAVQDGSLGTTLTLTAISSTARSVSYTAGVSFAANSYAAPVRIWCVNTGLSAAVMFVSMTSTSVVSVTPSGVVVEASKSAFLDVQPRAGLQVHFVGLSAATTVNWSAGTY